MRSSAPGRPRPTDFGRVTFFFRLRGGAVLRLVFRLADLLDFRAARAVFLLAMEFPRGKICRTPRAPVVGPTLFAKLTLPVQRGAPQPRCFRTDRRRGGVRGDYARVAERLQP